MIDNKDIESIDKKIDSIVKSFLRTKYVKYIVLWIVVVFCFFMFTGYKDEDFGLGIFISLVIGSILFALIVFGFREGFKKK